MALEQPIWSRFLPSKLVITCATLGPIGRARYAPGTWGSLAGLIYFTVFFYPLGVFGTVILTAIGSYIAVALCGEAEFRLGKRDPGEVVLDEFIAMPLCFLAWPQLRDVAPHWAIFIAGFGVFRLFDILKPFGIRKLQDLPGGWGVVADDIAAALLTCATLHGARAAWLWYAPPTVVPM
jgi:phosphatidylglycerophosphatase A